MFFGAALDRAGFHASWPVAHNVHCHARQGGGDESRGHCVVAQSHKKPGCTNRLHRGGAYWLIDAIASYFGDPKMDRAMAQDDRLCSLQFWHLKVRGGQSAVLTMRADSGEKPAITQAIPFTDFPLNSVDVWAGFDGTFWTLYLPSEH